MGNAKPSGRPSFEKPMELWSAMSKLKEVAINRGIYNRAGNPLPCLDITEDSFIRRSHK